MEMMVEEITPQMAEEYLSHNMVNRTINRNRVIAYSNDMKTGEWQLNGESIKFDDSGNMVDGQHRLSAIIRANVSVKTFVLRGVESGISLYDRGRNRSVTDTLIISGMNKALADKSVVAISKIYYRIYGISNTSDAQVRRFIEKYQDSLMTVYEISRGKTGKRSGSTRINVRSGNMLAPVFFALECGVPSETLNRFLEVVKTGFYESSGESAAIVCRNDIIAGMITMRGGDSARTKACYQIEKAISDFVEKYPRKVSYKNWDAPVYSNNSKFDIKNLMEE